MFYFPLAKVQGKVLGFITTAKNWNSIVFFSILITDSHALYQISLRLRYKKSHQGVNKCQRQMNNVRVNIVSIFIWLFYFIGNHRVLVEVWINIELEK